jgi:hypothetical protein
MINDFSYGRVQGFEGKNLDQELRTLMESFPRVIEQCYPLVVKRKQCIPMSVCRDTQLFEWESIARWGNVLPTIGDANAVVTSISESTYPGELIPCLPYFSSRSNNAISCEGRLGTLRVQMGLSYLKGDENTFVANINLPEFVTEKQRQSVTRFWSAGQSIWSPLSPFSISFEQDAKSNKYKVFITDSPPQQSYRCSLKFTTERDIAD